MKLVNEITVDAAPSDVFEFLANVERVAPCLPGASIHHGEGGIYHGSMKVRVGPISGVYEGTIRFLDLDRDRRRAVMAAQAIDATGQGNAEATIETEVAQSGTGSRLTLVTDLQLRGRVAQFGRGVIDRIAQRLFTEFAHNIQQQLTEGPRSDALTAGAQAVPSATGGAVFPPVPVHLGPAAAPSAGAPPPRPKPVEPPPVTLDSGVIFGPAVTRLGQVAIPAVIAFGYGYLLGRLREVTR